MDELFVCNDCKSENVAYLQWVHLNETDSVDDPITVEHDDNDYYCLDCKSNKVWEVNCDR